MRLVPDQNSPCPCCCLAKIFQETGLGQDHADIRHDRFGEDTSHVTRSKRYIERRAIVEFDGRSRRRDVVHLPNQAAPCFRHAVAQIDEHVIHGAMIAAIEDQYPAAARQFAAPAYHRPVGLGCGRRHLPERQSEPPGKQCADLIRFFRRQHGADSNRCLACNRGSHRRRRMTEHGCGVAEAEIVK